MKNTNTETELRNLETKLESLEAALGILEDLNADRHTIRALEDQRDNLVDRIAELKFELLPDSIKLPVDRDKADKAAGPINFTRGELYLLYSMFDGEHKYDLIDRAGYSYLYKDNEAKYDEFAEIVGEMTDKVRKAFYLNDNHDAGLI